jgi:hypothetical protein
MPAAADTAERTFESIGVCAELAKACASLGWRAPTDS